MSAARRAIIASIGSCGGAGGAGGAGGVSGGVCPGAKGGGEYSSGWPGALPEPAAGLTLRLGCVCTGAGGGISASSKVLGSISPTSAAEGFNTKGGPAVVLGWPEGFSGVGTAAAGVALLSAGAAAG